MRRELVEPSARRRGRGGLLRTLICVLCALHQTWQRLRGPGAVGARCIWPSCVRPCSGAPWCCCCCCRCRHVAITITSGRPARVCRSLSPPPPQLLRRRAAPHESVAAARRAVALCWRGAGRRWRGGCGQVLVPGAVSDRDRRQRPSRLITAAARIRRAALARAAGAWPRWEREWQRQRQRERDSWGAGAQALSRRSQQRGLLVAPRVDNLPAGRWRSTCVRGGERAIVRNLAPLQPYNAQTCVSSLGLHALAQHREAWMGIS
jgi:hypothetical protein